MSDKYVILPDVTCDLNREVREDFGVNFLRGHVKYPNGIEQPTFLDWSECKLCENCTAEMFYNALKKDPDGFSTAPPNEMEFYNAFEKYVLEGYGVIAVTISTGISGTYNFALSAKKEILAKYPDARIECVDSLRFGPGMGLLALHGIQLQQQGKTMQEVVDYLNQNKNRFHQMGWLDDLSFVAKKGRITHAKAFMGTLIGVKPLGEFDYNGLTTVLGKAKGEKAAYEVMLEYISRTIENPEDQVILIAQTNRRKQAEAYKKMIEDRFHPKKVYINDIFPACGINIGPGLMAAYYVGKPISEDLSQEKAIINELISK